jgi:diadenosine tetraphosphate (Ap4A) HIT family hydrolase
MALIYETNNFIVEAFEKPHIDRDDGGHIKIYPKKEIEEMADLSPKLATEFMRLIVVVGKAMEKGMNIRGLKIMTINYQVMGNWAYKKDEKPYFHIHLYGRARDAKYQPYTEAVNLPDRSSGFYDKFKPLNKQDVRVIKEEIEKLFQEEKYSNLNWNL